MRPPILVGIAIAVLIAAAGFLSPVFRSSGRKAADQAAESAALARRELARVDPYLQRVADVLDPNALAQADLEPAVQAAAADLQKVADESRRLVQRAQELAEQHDLPAPTVSPLAPSAAGVKQSLAEVQRMLQANDALLKAALADATAAASAARDAAPVPAALGAAQILGVAETVRAAGLLLSAHELRAAQLVKQAELLSLGGEWKQARGWADHFRGLDVAPMLATLRKDLEELATLREEAVAREAELAEQVAQRERELAEVEEQMRAARAELLELERRGFKAGADQPGEGYLTFAQYRQQYLDLTERLRDVQQREQELRFGARIGAELEGPDPLNAELVGGEPRVGLNDVRWRLDVAQARVKSLASAHESLEAQIGFITERGREAQAERRRYEERLTELAAGLSAAYEQLKELAAAAVEKEQQALSAAQSAIGAFGQAQSNAQAYVSAVKTTQRERDPEKRNERLTLANRDFPYLEQFAATGQAAAQVLAARIHALRLQGSQALLDDLEVLAEINPEAVTFDPAIARELVEAARTNGLELLEKARATYERVAAAQPATANVPYAQAALAAAQHLTARLDVAQADTWRSRAAETLATVVLATGGEYTRNPYLQPFVPLHQHLTTGGTTTRPAESESDTSTDIP